MIWMQLANGTLLNLAHVAKLAQEDIYRDDRRTCRIVATLANGGTSVVADRLPDRQEAQRVLDMLGEQIALAASDGVTWLTVRAVLTDVQLGAA